MTIVCKNCKNRFKGNFCSQCGQSADTHEINMHYLWHEIQHGILHVDNGIVYTTKQLLSRPGHAIREFVDGKRVQYFKPLAFVFILSSIYAVLTHFFHIQNPFTTIELSAEDIAQINNQDLTDKLQELSLWIGSHYAYMVLLILPVTSLASYLAFGKKSGNYLKHLVLNAYITGFCRLIAIFFIPLQIVVNYNFTDVIVNTENVLRAAFLTWAYIQFFDYNSVFKNILLTAIAVIYFWLIVLVPIFILLFVIKGSL